MEVFAHRGSSRDHPENTRPAFEAAIAEGATGIETDLRRTRDGAIVLVHDPDLRRVAGVRRRVASLDLAALQRIPVGGGAVVPTLEELWGLAARRVRLNLEVKDPQVIPALASFLRGRRGDVLVTSAHFEVLDDLAAALPGLAVGPVLSRFGPRTRARVERGAYAAVSLADDACRDAVLDFCREAHLDLLVWVVNDPHRAAALARRGVAGIFTDCPGPVVRSLRNL